MKKKLGVALLFVLLIFLTMSPIIHKTYVDRLGSNYDVGAFVCIACIVLILLLGGLALINSKD